MSTYFGIVETLTSGQRLPARDRGCRYLIRGTQRSWGYVYLVVAYTCGVESTNATKKEICCVWNILARFVVSIFPAPTKLPYLNL